MSSPTTDRRYGLASGTAIKAPCKAATTGNITLSGTQTIDGIACVSGDRVLVKDQTDSTQNGIYLVDTGAWVRDADFNDNLDLVRGTLVNVIDGALNANTIWRVATTAPSIGSALTFQQNALSSSNSSSITFTQSGAGAVAQSVQTKFRDLYTSKDFGATGSPAVDTAYFQACVDAAILAAKPAHFSPGLYLTGPVDLNGTGHATPVGSQWTAVSELSGAGRIQTLLRATGAYGANYVLACKNAPASHIHDIGVDGNGIAAYGCDFSWNSIGPSPNNIFENIWVQGCATRGITFDNQNEAKVSGIYVRDVTAGNIGISYVATGGTVEMDNVWCMGGLFKLGCQDAGIVNSSFWHGVKLFDGGLNNVVWDHCHFYPDDSLGNPVTIDSDQTTPGSYTSQGNIFNTCYFESAYSIVKGRWHQGAIFNGCYFNAWSGGGNFGAAGVIGDVGGSGSIPTFEFNHCTFASSTLPSSVPGQFNVVLNNCKVLNNRFTPELFTSLQLLNPSDTASITLPDGISLLMLSHQNLATPAALRTDALYVVSNNGSTMNMNALYTNLGSSTGEAFTLTQTAANVLTLTNTSTSQTVLRGGIYTGTPWHL